MLTADDLARQLLRTYESHGATDGVTSTVGDPWPMAMEESWSAVRVDGMVHATFWVAEWPRTEVRSDFLGAAAPGLGPLDRLGGHGASRARHRRAQGGGVPDG